MSHTSTPAATQPAAAALCSLHRQCTGTPRLSMVPDSSLQGRAAEGCADRAASSCPPAPQSAALHCACTLPDPAQLLDSDYAWHAPQQGWATKQPQKYHYNGSHGLGGHRTTLFMSLNHRLRLLAGQRLGLTQPSHLGSGACLCCPPVTAIQRYSLHTHAPLLRLGRAAARAGPL